jgi:glyoxylate/hydroxypyruvate reductase
MAIMKIVITCPSAKESQRWAEMLREDLPGHGVQAVVVPLVDPTQAAPDADFAIGWRPYPAFFQRHPQLKAFFNMGAGLDYFFDNPEMLGLVPEHVPIIRLEDAGMGLQMADYCRHQVFDWMYNFARYRAQQARSEWRGWRERHALDRSQVTVGVLGLGILGSAVAQAFARDGFTVSGYARTPRQVEGVRYVSDLQTFLAGSRVVIVLAPATPDTRHILRAETLAMMPQGAYLINLARGALLNEPDLVAALDSGHLAGACLDVFETEPLPTVSPLWSHPNVVITPHSSAPTLMRPSAQQIMKKIALMAAGKSITGIANRSNS